MLTLALIALDIIGGFLALCASIGGGMGVAGLADNRQRNPHDFNWAVCLMMGVPSIALSLVTVHGSGEEGEERRCKN